MLSKKQAQLVKRAIILKVLFAKNTELVNGFKPMQNEVALFLTYLDVAEGELPEKDINGKGDTTAKDLLKRGVATESSLLCRIAKGYAIAAGKQDLASAMGCSYSQILRMKDTEVLGWVKKQYAMLTPLVNDPVFMEYQITQEMLDAMLKDGETFNSSLGQNKVKDTNSNVANANINTALSGMNGNIKQFDLLINHYSKTAPDFVKNYKAARKRGDAGVKHNGLSGKLTGRDLKTPVAEATVRLAGTKKQAVSGLRGQYEIIGVKTGEYKLEVLVDDVVVSQMIIDIKRGVVLEQNIAI